MTLLSRATGEKMTFDEFLHDKIMNFILLLTEKDSFSKKLFKKN